MSEDKKCYICGKDIPEEDDICWQCNDERYYTYEQELTEQGEDD
ncbi:hypothetical protein [Listeria seeligeri]|nr:hypothetical protein [Listeria seeligeri]